MKPLFYLLIITLIASCNTVKVSKVTTGKEKGVRYALARPYIQVTPNPGGDGSYTVEVVYLPDADQTYAVQSKSFLGKNSMEVKVDESGILSKIDWSGASDAVAVQTAESLGSVAKAEMERRKTEKDKAEEEAKKKKEDADNAVKTLKESLAQKQLDLKLASLELAQLETIRAADRTAEIKEKMRQLRLTIVRLEDEIKAINSKLTQAQSTADELAGAFNEPAVSDDEEAWGPVLFKIVNGTDAKGNLTVKLEAVTWTGGNKQEKFKTAAKVTPPVKPASQPELTTNGTVTEAFDNKGIAKIAVSFNTTIENIDKNQSQIIAFDGAVNPDFNKVAISITDKKNVVFTFDKKDIRPGKYILNIRFTYKDGDETKSGRQQLDIDLK